MYTCIKLCIRRETSIFGRNPKNLKRLFFTAFREFHVPNFITSSLMSPPLLLIY